MSIMGLCNRENWSKLEKKLLAIKKLQKKVNRYNKDETYQEIIQEIQDIADEYHARNGGIEQSYTLDPSTIDDEIQQRLDELKTNQKKYRQS